MEMSLSDVVRIVWEKKWLIVVLTVCFVLGVYYFWSQQSEMYIATVVMESNSESSIDTINYQVATYDRLVRTRKVAEMISENTEPKVATEQVLGRANVEYITGTRLFQVNVVDSDPKTAIKLANASASGLAEYLLKEQKQQNIDVEKNLEERLKAIKGVVDKNMASGLAPYSTSSNAQEAIDSQLLELYLTGARVQMENASSPKPVSIIDKATYATRTLNISKSTLIVMAIILGLIINSSLVVIFSRMRLSYGRSKNA